MKRFLALLLLLSLLCLCGCSNVADPTVTEESAETTEPSEMSEPVASTCTPILYKVTAENDAVLYLFGSIHATDSRAYPLPDYVMQAYAESSYLAVECDVNAFASDVGAQVELAKKMVLTDGTTVADHLGQETYAAAKTFLTDYSAYYPLYDSYHPAMWMSLLEAEIVEMSGLSTDNGIDVFFLSKAADEEKEIREIESVEFQYDMLLGFSDELISKVIADYVNDPQTAAEETMTLYEYWLSGDEAALVVSFTQEAQDEDTEAYEEYNTKMITERNLSMADTAEEYLTRGGTGFFVVGAAHILGEGGCVELLTERGYAVERVG